MIAKYCYILAFLLPFTLYGQTQRRLIDSSGGLVWSSVSNTISQQISVLVRQGDTIFAAHGGLGAIFSVDDGQSWQRSGMTKPIYGLATSGERLYTVAEDGKPYYSGNAGISWIPAGYVDSALGYYQKINLVANGNNGVILCVYQDFTPRQNFFSHIYVSQNGGSIWNKRQIRLRGASSIVFLGEMLIATGAHETTNLSYSLDVGKSWLPLPNFSENIVGLYTSGTKLYVIGSSRRIFISSDSAKTWKRCAEVPDITFRVPFPTSSEQQGNSGLPFNIQQGRRSIENITVSGNGTITICLSNNLIFSSDDEGISWKLINSQLWKTRGYVARVILTTLTSIVVGGPEGIFRCNTNGENLQKVCASNFHDRYWFSQCNENYNLFATTGIRKKTYFLSGNAGLFRSNDGWIWQQVMPQMHRWKATNPINPFEFVHPIESQAYFSSLDGDYCVNALVGNDKIIVALTKDGTVLRSGDNGTTWIPVRQDTRFASDNALLLLRQSTLLAFINGAEFRSSDNGVSWQEIPSIKNLGILASGKNAIKSVAANNTAMFAATEQDFMRSLDDGITWSKHIISLNSKEVYSISADHSTLLAATDKGIFRSVNNGISWEEAKTPNDLISPAHFVLALDRNVAIGVADTVKSIFSVDDGKKWHLPTPQPFWLYRSSVPFSQKVASLASNKTSVLALTNNNFLYHTDIPIDLGITYTMYDTNADSEESRVGFAPNPTQGIVRFSWQQQNYGKVSIGIFDTSGRIVGGFTEIEYAPGTHSYIWDGSTMAAGTYFCRYVIGDRVYSGMIAVAR